MLHDIRRPKVMNAELQISGEISLVAADILPTPTLLMCPPGLYEVKYVINPWMHGNLGNSSRPRAVLQWEELYAILSRLAHVLLIDPVPDSPDMVFTANAGLAHEGTVAISSFYHRERQGEEPYFHRWF